MVMLKRFGDAQPLMLVRCFLALENLANAFFNDSDLLSSLGVVLSSIGTVVVDVLIEGRSLEIALSVFRISHDSFSHLSSLNCTAESWRRM